MVIFQREQNDISRTQLAPKAKWSMSYACKYKWSMIFLVELPLCQLWMCICPKTQLVPLGTKTVLRRRPTHPRVLQNDVFHGLRTWTRNEIDIKDYDKIDLGAETFVGRNICEFRKFSALSRKYLAKYFKKANLQKFCPLKIHNFCSRKLILTKNLKPKQKCCCILPLLYTFFCIRTSLTDFAFRCP